MLYLEKAKIYGVDQVGGSSPNLVRTDDAIGLAYSRSNSEIKSDFDNCYPWSEMHEEVDEFGNVFVRIPKFYTKITKNSDGTYKHQISGTRYSGFTTLFIDGHGNEIDYVLVGKYEGSGNSAKVFSKSGQTVLVNITQANFRAGCKANGEGYQQYDYLIDLIIKELFTIEFATTNTQSIMQGYTAGTNTAALITGHTDQIKTPSGSGNTEHDEECTTCHTDGEHAMKYRGMENIWGNTWTHVDGISFNEEKVYVCTDPTAYESGKTEAPYFYVGDRCTTDGYAKEIAPLDKNPLMLFTKNIGAGVSSYYSDYYYYKAAGQILFVGGYWYSGTHAGLWSWSGDYGVSNAYSGIGGRLCKKPL